MAVFYSPEGCPEEKGYTGDACPHRGHDRFAQHRDGNAHTHTHMQMHLCVYICAL